jgi:hypothetical protein
LARLVQLNTRLWSWLENAALRGYRLRLRSANSGPDFDLENEGPVARSTIEQRTDGRWSERYKKQSLRTTPICRQAPYGPDTKSPGGKRSGFSIVSCGRPAPKSRGRRCSPDSSRTGPARRGSRWHCGTYRSPARGTPCGHGGARQPQPSEHSMPLSTTHLR